MVVVNNAREVSLEQYQQIADLLAASNAKRDESKSPCITLAAKLALQREAADLRDQAMMIGVRS